MVQNREGEVDIVEGIDPAELEEAALKVEASDADRIENEPPQWTHTCAGFWRKMMSQLKVDLCFV